MAAEGIQSMEICHIVGAMEPGCAIVPETGDLLIAADAGHAILAAQGLAPDWTVGDFDSLPEIPTGPKVLRYPVMKDETDMLLAVKLGLEQGYRSFCLYGGLGGRTDHTIANIQTLAYLAEHGAAGYLLGPEESITLIRPGRLHFHGYFPGTLSLFAYGGEARGVTLSGFRYPLNKATLSTDFPLGVSNEFANAAASVQFDMGRLLVIWSGVYERTKVWMQCK